MDNHLHNHSEHEEHEEHEHSEPEESQELMMRASLIEKHLQELNDRIDYISQQITELEEFKNNLKFLKDAKNKEMLASLGKGIYLKSSCQDDNFFVNVGAGIVVKKTPEETAEIISSQIKNLHEAKTSLLGSFEVYQRLMGQALSDLKNKNQAS
jgi:prefoldin alpha subunit